MLTMPSRHRSLTLLAVVVAAQVILLAVQIRSDQQVRLIRVWAVEMVTPFGRAAVWTADRIAGVWNGYIGLRHLRQENERLRAELDGLKLRNITLEGRAAEADRLSDLLAFREAHAEVPMLAARVIGASPDAGSRIVFLSRGSDDGVRPNMGVITPQGVVGKVIAVFPTASQVLLLSDKQSGVGALLAGSRTQGPVRGTGEPLLTMEYVVNEVPVAPGEAVLTSGQDRIFPKDLPVGTVVEARPDPRGPFQQIRVRPAARLDQLEEVLVLLTLREFPPVRASSTEASAAPGPEHAGTAPARGAHSGRPPSAP